MKKMSLGEMMDLQYEVMFNAHMRTAWRKKDIKTIKLLNSEKGQTIVRRLASRIVSKRLKVAI